MSENLVKVHVDMKIAWENYGVLTFNLLTLGVWHRINTIHSYEK